MIGRTLAHYRITAALGTGGMGEVYRASDTKLGRDVALKVLPAEMASSPERLERFRREVKALAALDHLGVVTVYAGRPASERNLPLGASCVRSLVDVVAPPGEVGLTCGETRPDLAGDRVRVPPY